MGRARQPEGPMTAALRLRAAARAARPGGDKTDPLPAADLERVRVDYGRAVANLCEFPHWLLTREGASS